MISSNNILLLISLLWSPNLALNICGLAAVNVQHPSLFEDLTKTYKPMATISRNYSLKRHNVYSIKKNTSDSEGIIEETVHHGVHKFITISVIQATRE